jgi:putative DNA primase/helicase
VADQDRKAAHEYLDWGWTPLPCAPRTKYPLIKWEPYQAVKTVSHGDVDGWFGTDRPKNIWLMCGPRSGLIVVDLDGFDTVRWFRQLCPELDFPTIPRVKTSKGWHLYFAWAAGTDQWHYDGQVNGLNINLDVRNGERGGVLAPPSVHDKTDHVYAWEVRPPLGDDGRPQLPALPPQLYTRSAAGVTGAATVGTSGHQPPVFTTPPGEGGRNTWLAGQAGHLAKKFRNDRTSYDSLFDLLAQQVPGLDPEEVAKTRESIWHREQSKDEDTLPLQLASPNNPTLVARQLLAREWTRDELVLLRYWRGDFYTWEGPHWLNRDDVTIRSRVRHLTEHAAYLEQNKKGEWESRQWLPNNAKLANVLTGLTDILVPLIDEHAEPPTWTGGGAHQADLTVVPVANGLLTYPHRKLLPHTPHYFNIVSSPFAYDPAAAPPTRWLRFLDDVWPDQEDAAALLQEWFGMMLTAETKYQKILLLIGPKRSGKGTIARILRQLVGPANAVSVTAGGFASTFGMQDLVGKTMVTVPDARVSGPNALALAERLLSISGEDPITIERKYKTGWTGKLGTRLLILSNEFPRLPDASGALANRYLPLQFTKSWFGKEDHDLETVLVGELPGILNWALDGLDRLTARKRYVLPAGSADIVSDLESLGSPVLAFVRDWCETGDPMFEAETGRLFSRWNVWCALNGIRATSAPLFGRDLRSAIEGLGEVWHRSEGKRLRYYTGIRLTKDAEHETAPTRPIQTFLN